MLREEPDEPDHIDTVARVWGGYYDHAYRGVTAKVAVHFEGEWVVFSSFGGREESVLMERLGNQLVPAQERIYSHCQRLFEESRYHYRRACVCSNLGGLIAERLSDPIL